MIEIDALLTTGQPALVDLHGASPSGGMVRTESRPGRRLLPGDVIRHCGAWVVVADVRHNGITGLTTVGAFTRDNEVVRETYTGDSAEVRTDTRIDPDSLWRLAELAQVVMEPDAAAAHAEWLAEAEELAEYA